MKIIFNAYIVQPIVVLLIGLSGLIGVAVGMSKNGQPPFDPFAPYAYILPEQAAESVTAPRFTCDHSNPSSQRHDSLCLANPANGLFSQISVTMSEQAIIKRAAFTLRQNSLQVGDLISLWGKSTSYRAGNTAYLYWPERCTTAWVKIDNRQYYVYRLPISYIVFDCSYLSISAIQRQNSH